MKETDKVIKEKLLEKYKNKEERIDNWIITVFKNHYKKNSYDFNKNYISVEERKKYIKPQDLHEEVSHIIDFLKSNKSPRKIERLSYLDAKRLSENWTINLNKKASLIEEKSSILKVKDLDDGYSIVQLRKKSSFQREGKLMKHCVSGYYTNPAILYSPNGINKIYSLRDRENIPHCTVEINYKAFDDSKIIQIQGKSNQKVKLKHRFFANDMMNFIMLEYGIKYDSLSSHLKNKFSVKNILECYTKNIKKQEKPKRRYLMIEKKEIKDEIIKKEIQIEYNGAKELELKLSNIKGLIVSDDLDIYSQKENVNIPKNLKFEKLVDIESNKNITISDNIVFYDHVILKGNIVKLGSNVIFESGVTIKARDILFSEDIIIKNVLNLICYGADIFLNNLSFNKINNLKLEGIKSILGLKKQLNLKLLEINNTEMKKFPFDIFQSSEINLFKNKSLRDINNINSIKVVVKSNDIEKIGCNTEIGNLRIYESKIDMQSISDNSDISIIKIDEYANLLNMDESVKFIEKAVTFYDSKVIKEIEQKIYSNLSNLNSEIKKNIKIYNEDISAYMESDLVINYKDIAINTMDSSHDILIVNNEYDFKNNFNYKNIKIRIGVKKCKKAI